MRKNGAKKVSWAKRLFDFIGVWANRFSLCQCYEWFFFFSGPSFFSQYSSKVTNIKQIAQTDEKKRNWKALSESANLHHKNIPNVTDRTRDSSCVVIVYKLFSGFGLQTSIPSHIMRKITKSFTEMKKKRLNGIWDQLVWDIVSHSTNWTIWTDDGYGKHNPDKETKH